MNRKLYFHFCGVVEGLICILVFQGKYFVGVGYIVGRMFANLQDCYM